MRLAAVMAGVALVLAGCSSDDESVGQERERQGPGAFIEATFGEQYTQGQYGRMWESLHPEHQAIVSKGEYDACQRSAARTGLRISDVQVEETYDETIDLPGTGKKVDALAVTWSAVYELGDERVDSTETSHLIDVGGQWRWLMADPADCVGDV